MHKTKRWSCFTRGNIAAPHNTLVKWLPKKIQSDQNKSKHFDLRNIEKFWGCPGLEIEIFPVGPQKWFAGFPQTSAECMQTAYQININGWSWDSNFITRSRSHPITSLVAQAASQALEPSWSAAWPSWGVRKRNDTYSSDRFPFPCTKLVETDLLAFRQGFQYAIESQKDSGHSEFSLSVLSCPKRFPFHDTMKINPSIRILFSFCAILVILILLARLASIGLTLGEMYCFAERNVCL